MNLADVAETAVIGALTIAGIEPFTRSAIAVVTAVGKARTAKAADEDSAAGHTTHQRRRWRGRGTPCRASGPNPIRQRDNAGSARIAERAVWPRPGHRHRPSR